jgi:hypothetical protein
MLNHVALTGNGSCKTPVDENLELGHNLNITARRRCSSPMARESLGPPTRPRWNASSPA